MSYTPAHLAELGLSLWRQRGADAAAQVAPPVDRRQTSRESQPGESQTSSVRPMSAGPAPNCQAEAPAADPQREVRILAMDWEALESHVRGQSRGEARQAVFGVGARNADLMVIGEAPGAEEDARGEPFVGRAGKLLDQMLRAIGLDRESTVYIANICKFRPPNNRDPRPEEVAEDMPYLRRQIQLVQPRVLLAVGRIAAQNLLDRSDPIGRLRGKELVHAESGLPVIVTYHPAYLLRSPREKAKAWQDLKRARALLTAG